MIRRRTTELGLLVLVTLVTGGAYVLASLGRGADIPADTGPFLGVVLALLLAAHLAVRRLAPGADGLLLPLAGLLNGLGYAMIARLDADLAANQSAWTVLGVVAFVATLVLLRDVRLLERYRYTLALVGVAMLLLPLSPLGVNINGARIWIRLGPFSVQPGEFAKVALAAFLAGFLVEKRDVLTISTRRLGPVHVPDLKHFGPMLLAWGVALVVMTLQRDLGSSLLFFTLFLTMLYVATGRGAFVAAGLVLFGAGAVGAWRVFDHVQQRVDIWLDPFADARGTGFQIVEAAFALAEGGVTGTGLGLGSPGRIPYAETDMVFAAIGEELGLFGATAVLASYLLLLGAGLRVATAAPSPFEKLLVAGLTALLGFQTVIIVGGVIRVLPLTGITLPFVSYGGSSLVANYLVLALLVRVSDRTAQRARTAAPVAA